jgi:Mg-chelatase subunit ChlD
MPLTNNWTALNGKIDSMTPNGNTNVTIGLVWAWHALTPGAPLSEASAPKKDLDKVIILLTDGDNTEAWKNSSGSKVTKTSTIDARTKLACDNAKAANIKIYAIRVIDGNADLLRNCATNPSMYYDVQNASQLSSVFGAIAQNLANLRLAK